ncbi:hypothetical protein [Streptomyces sp. SID3343]|uniref:hypothetical protein n=1 Tax=Streptomyces sp. SID3343 TaxID=2690260 RepID=UPI00136AE45E|nr:hypothetical protein [Streptomyces sp. SID3343]MYV97305.1 hypothetical protein [Streptomyces sp. SID3343]
MNKPMLGFAAHPQALGDLQRLPPHIREFAVRALDALVRDVRHGTRLGDRGGYDLTDCRRLVLDEDRAWRLVYQDRPAPADSPYRREVVLVAVGARQDHAAYNTAAQRLGRDRTPPPEPGPIGRRATAARVRSTPARAVASVVPSTTPTAARANPGRSR